MIEEKFGCAGERKPRVRLPGAINACHNAPNCGGSQEIVNPASISFDDLMRYGDKMGALNRAVMKQLTVEEFADLQTIFYVGRDRRFGEEYPRLLETTLAAHRLAKERYAFFHRILSKRNFIDGLAAGLRRVGQPALGDKVVHMRDTLLPAECR